MKGEKLKKRIDKEFKKITKNKFLSPQNCTQLKQTRAHIFELNRIIHHFERKFNYIPTSAQLLFDEYNTKQEKMLFEKYKDDFLND
jgi:hypothetical protein